MTRPPLCWGKQIPKRNIWERNWHGKVLVTAWPPRELLRSILNEHPGVCQDRQDLELQEGIVEKSLQVPRLFKPTWDVMRSGKDEGGEQGISHEAENTELEEKEGPSLCWLECPASHSQRCGNTNSGILLASFPSIHRDFILYSIFLSLTHTLQFDNNRSLMEYTQFKNTNYKEAIFQH